MKMLDKYRYEIVLNSIHVERLSTSGFDGPMRYQPTTKVEVFNQSLNRTVFDGPMMSLPHSKQL